MKQREKLWTPGPWEYSKDVNVVWGDLNCSRSQPGCNLAVARMVVKHSNENIEANAQLISAAPDLVEEHEIWASLIGEVYALIQQANYSEAKRLLDQSVTIDFKANDGAPAALSPALDKAYGQSPCKSCGDFGSTCDVCGNQGDSQ